MLNYDKIETLPVIISHCVKRMTNGNVMMGMGGAVLLRNTYTIHSKNSWRTMCKQPQCAKLCIGNFKVMLKHILKLNIIGIQKKEISRITWKVLLNPKDQQQS